VFLSLANKRRWHKKNVPPRTIPQHLDRNRWLISCPDSFTPCKVPVSAVDESRSISVSLAVIRKIAQAMYAQRNTEARSCNDRRHGKAIGIYCYV